MTLSHRLAMRRRPEGRDVEAQLQGAFLLIAVMNAPVTSTEGEHAQPARLVLCFDEGLDIGMAQRIVAIIAPRR